MFSILFFAGCTSTLEGDVYENKKPIVYFATIPPEGQDFSSNPVIYWYGTDNDGLIDYYRYHIATINVLGDLPPEDYVLTLSDDDWNYIDVDPAHADPHTKNSLPLTADTTNPVRGFVPQWVFLQAYDIEGLASEVAYRLFLRNDNPPETFVLINEADMPFVNSELPGGIVTGVGIRWIGEDPIDYPSDPPPFEFEWRLYGPYTDEDTAVINDTYRKEVFVTIDGFVYEIGETIFWCRDSVTIEGITVEVCDTFLVEHDLENPLPSILGEWDNIFDIEDPGFISSEYNVVEDSSWNGVDTWILNTSDTLYNVFKSVDINVTFERVFLFWCRSRDDAFVPDLTPACSALSVINPKFENDVAVLDFTFSRGFNRPNRDFDMEAWWIDKINRWDPLSGFSSDDYYNRSIVVSSVPLLKFLLSYKMLICINESLTKSGISSLDKKISSDLYKSIDAGVNVWLTMRCPLVSAQNVPPSPFIFPGPDMTAEYSFYFAVRQTQFSGWTFWGTEPPLGDAPYQFRIEDFVGAYSLQPEWPEVNVLGTHVENRLRDITLDGMSFNPDIPALGEVNYSVAGLGAEVMYLYKSFYGPSHPFGRQMGFDYNQEGTPVGHRFNTGVFKTTHFDFTMTCLDDTTLMVPGDSSSIPVQVLIDTVLNFLYDPSIAAPVSEVRYDDAGLSLSISELRAKYWERNAAKAREKGLWPWDPNGTIK